MCLRLVQYSNARIVSIYSNSKYIFVVFYRSRVLLLWLATKKVILANGGLKWIVQTTTLFDDMFGPDNFTFRTVNTSVVVHEDSWPKLAYNHTWEEN